ncbi:hypothetical protein [Tahibacter amnicola]|uniref:Uncharacterized protein n=1 Tax=Tahibacter amnicola TaxID=2976241 RepID=A0ABY6BDT1_9GAMM|nr:hypothetical protein [Tahibacter amnicola]UXI67967.1 hypothetical protein N4264_25105 [Tahibacter amnicola]
MYPEFEDIRIVDLDLKKTTWSRVHETLRIMFLRLNREPPDNDWTRLFFEERETRIVSRRRGLWIEDGYISFDTLPDEVEKVHLPDIAKSIEYANARYRELLAQKRQKLAEAQAEQRSEHDELLALRDRLRSVFGPAPAAPEPPPTPSRPVFGPGSYVAPSPAPAAAPVAANPINEFQARRDALKQRFRHALTPKDKEQKGGDD